MKKNIFLIIFILFIIPINIYSMEYSRKRKHPSPEEQSPSRKKIETEFGSDFISLLPEELSEEILKKIVFETSKNLNEALNNLYQVAMVNANWQRLAFDHVLIKNILEKFALTKEGILKEDALIPVWNLLNHLRRANLKITKGKTTKQIDNKIEKLDEELSTTYGFIYKTIDYYLDDLKSIFLNIDRIKLYIRRNENLAFTPMNRYLAIISYGYIGLYNLETKQMIEDIPYEYPIPVFSSPNGKYLAIAPRFSFGIYRKDHIINIMDLEENTTMSIEHVINGIFTPDNKYIATTNNNKNISIYDVKKREFQVLTRYNENEKPLAFSHNAKYLATESDNILKMYNLIDRNVLNFDLPNNKKISSIVFSPNNKYLALIFYDQTGVILDLEEKKPILNIEHESSTTPVKFSPDSSHLLTETKNKNLNLNDYHLYKKTKTVFENGSLEKSTFSNGDKYFALVLENSNVVKIFNLTNKAVNILNCDNRVNCIAFNPDNNYIVIAVNGKPVKIFNLNPLKQIKEFKEWSHNTNHSLAFSSDNKYLAIKFDNFIKTYCLISDINKKLYIKIRSYLKENKIKYPRGNIFLRYLYNKSNFNNIEKAALLKI